MSDQPVSPPSTPSPRRLRTAGLIALVVIVVAVGLGITTRITQAHRLKTWTDAQADPSVNVVHPERSAAGQPLQLPGRIEAFTQAPIYARIAGYLKSWQVDIGAPVKRGQLLAQIETPDLDQQLLQAKADLASAEANAALAKTTAARWKSMLASDSVSRQEVDEKVGDYTAKKALAEAARANLDRLQATKGYTHLVAPFDGVVTARNTDVGDLVSEGSASGQALFVVADTRKMRVYVQVPQSYAPQIRPGAVAQLTVPERPGHVFKATVLATAGAVSAASGSTLVQLVVDNPGGALMPGSYAGVTFDVDADAKALRVPASALVIDDQGTRVATVDAAGQVKFKPVTIQRDFGKNVEIGAGLSAQDRVIDSPPDGLIDGTKVIVVDADKTAAAHEHA